MKIIFCLIQILAILLCNSASAKIYGNRGTPTVTPWEFGLSSGLSIFGTSIDQEANAQYKRHSYWFREVNPGIGLFVTRNISPSLGIELNWLNTRLTGEWNRTGILPASIDPKNPLTFNSQINQFNLMMVFNVNQIMLPGDEEDRGHFFIKTGMGISLIKDNKKDSPNSTSSGISYALGGGYSVSLNEKLKLQIGSTTIAVSSDNLDGLHIVPKGKNGLIIKPKNIFEIYNYSYLSVTYSIDEFSLRKHKSTYRKRR